MENIIFFLKKNKQVAITEMHNIGIKKLKKLIFYFLQSFGRDP